MSGKPRMIGQFSCGAASAVACKIALADYRDTHQIAIINAFLKEEHPDNRRFAKDCAVWFGIPIIELRDEKYGASTHEVWRRKRYLKGPHGAPCSQALKRAILDSWIEAGDIIVIGYTAEEEDRFDDFRERNPDMKVICPLIDHRLTKGDCLAMVERAGIRIPEMYRLGYPNANCIGCPKGGEGYWNKIRIDFPEQFEAIATIQEEIGEGAYIFRNRKTGERYSLRDLPPDRGRMSDELNFECSIMCSAAERNIKGDGV